MEGAAFIYFLFKGSKLTPKVTLYIILKSP